MHIASAPSIVPLGTAASSTLRAGAATNQVNLQLLNTLTAAGFEKKATHFFTGHPPIIVAEIAGGSPSQEAQAAAAEELKKLALLLVLSSKATTMLGLKFTDKHLTVTQKAPWWRRLFGTSKVFSVDKKALEERLLPNRFDPKPIVVISTGGTRAAAVAAAIKQIPESGASPTP